LELNFQEAKFLSSQVHLWKFEIFFFWELLLRARLLLFWEG
jgi:hypothetical protein